MKVKMMYGFIWLRKRAAVGQSVYRMTAGWTANRSVFESQYAQEFLLLHIV
jgi:hypothetical protein